MQVFDIWVPFVVGVFQHRGSKASSQSEVVTTQSKKLKYLTSFSIRLSLTPLVAYLSLFACF